MALLTLHRHRRFDYYTLQFGNSLTQRPLHLQGRISHIFELELDVRYFIRPLAGSRCWWVQLCSSDSHSPFRRTRSAYKSLLSCSFRCLVSTRPRFLCRLFSSHLSQGDLQSTFPNAYLSRKVLPRTGCPFNL